MSRALARFTPVLRLVTSFVALVAMSTLVHAQNVLDWDVLDYTTNASSQTYTNVDGSGVDITITVETGSLLVEDNSNFTGGLSPTEESLYVLLNQSAQEQYIDITITFSKSVEDLTFSLFDVDTGPTAFTNGGFEFTTFRDDVFLTASNKGVSESATTITTGSTNFVDSFGFVVGGPGSFNEAQNNSNSAGGNVTVFFDDFVDTITIRYGSSIVTQDNPNQQAISLHDLSFVPVPEPSTYFAGVMLVLAAGVVHWKRRKGAK